MPSLNWTDTLLVGDPAMDATHREFVALIDQAMQAAEPELRARLEALQQHTQQHFDDEDRAMKDGAFPSAQCHLDEHQAVLRSFGEVLALPDERFREAAPRLVEALADWLPEHTSAMDLGVAQWLTKKRTGGAAMVFQRGAGRA